MNQITAPYGFVPLADKVVFPKWLEIRGGLMPPVHDVPFEHGLCGTLELEIEAETPIFTRGTRDKTLPFQLDDGTYALPGTALRGALRNVLEIATFSRFSQVNDHRYAIRDLHNRRQYLDYMAAIVKSTSTGAREPMPLVNAGWLTCSTNEHDDWEDLKITTCDFAKIEYRQVMEAARQVGLHSYNPGQKQKAAEKYDAWTKKTLDVNVSISWSRPNDTGDGRLLSRYGQAVLQRDGNTGHLVFTGQPQSWRPGDLKKKHHDFVFINRPESQSDRFEVTSEVFEAFEFGHSNRGEQNNLGRSLEPNAEWAYWGPRLKNGEKVPVFFLLDPKGRLKSLGLAMMFRMPYEFRIGDAIDNVSADHRGAKRPLDFAEGVFGTVRTTRKDQDDRTAPALKGRVGISHARALGQVTPGPRVLTVLSGPKASYYPNYVEQDRKRPGSNPPNNDAYKTWNDKDGAPRGWKRYRVLTETWLPDPPTGTGGRPIDLTRSSVATEFRPLPANTRFRAHVDVHNLLPEELGALLWTFDFGGDTAARHMMGMARPLGYGRAKVSVCQMEIRDHDGKPVDLSICRTKFVEYMRSQVPDWEKSPQILELKALVRPVPSSSAQYQRLDSRDGNQFVNAKKAGLALPAAFNHPGGQASAAPQGGDGFRGQQGGNGHGAQQQGYRGGAQGGTGLRGGPGGGYQGRREGPSRPEPPPIPAPKYDGPPQRAQPTPVQGGEPWRGKKKDDVIEIELLEINRKGKWRCKVVGYAGTQGTVTGTPSADAAPGKRYKVSVVVGNDPGNLELKWATE